jgi:hypothetical protein
MFKNDSRVSVLLFFMKYSILRSLYKSHPKNEMHKFCSWEFLWGRKISFVFFLRILKNSWSRVWGIEGSWVREELLCIRKLVEWESVECHTREKESRVWRQLGGSGAQCDFLWQSKVKIMLLNRGNIKCRILFSEGKRDLRQWAHFEFRLMQSSTHRRKRKMSMLATRTRRNQMKAFCGLMILELKF